MAKSTPEKLAYAKAYRERHRERINAYFRGRKAIKNAQRRTWNEANRDRQKAANEAHHLKRYHGLTVKQYRDMVSAQGGLCAVCGDAPSGAGHCGRLHVDHDHVTGVIRGLLCVNCNQGLGHFKDSPARLAKATMYLHHHANHRHTA